MWWWQHATNNDYKKLLKQMCKRWSNPLPGSCWCNKILKRHYTREHVLTLTEMWIIQSIFRRVGHVARMGPWEMSVGRLEEVITYLTKSMDLRPFREATRCGATHELPSIMWSQQGHYSAHQSPLLGPTLRQTNPVRTSHSLSTHLHLGLHSGLFSTFVFPPIGGTR
jgi:hypothetical protein